MQSHKWQNDLCFFPRQVIQYHSYLSLCPNSNAEEAEVEQFQEGLQDLLEVTPRKDVLLIIGDWKAKVGHQELPGIIDTFGLGVKNEAGKKLIYFFQENALVIEKTVFQKHKRRLYTWTSWDGQYQNQIDYILCSQDGEAIHSQQKKKDQEMTVAQIMNSLLLNSDLNRKTREKPLNHSGMT